MKFLKTLFIGLVTFCLMLVAVGCPNGTESSQNDVTNANNNGNKITSLQSVIDSNEIGDGDTIDLSQSAYSEINNYDAVISKSVTIKGGSDLKGGELKVIADGVVLDNIHNANVSTQSSMKISASTLNNLNIEEIDDDTAVNPNAVISRAELDRRPFPRRPNVYTSNKTKIKTKVKVSIPETLLSVNDSEAAKIELNAENAQLTVEDGNTKINAI